MCCEPILLQFNTLVNHLGILLKMKRLIKKKYREILLQINQNHVDGNSVSLLDIIAYTRVVDGYIHGLRRYEVHDIQL